MNKYNKKYNGFTLMQVLVVIAVIFVLFSIITLPNSKRSAKLREEKNTACKLSCASGNRDDCFKCVETGGIFSSAEYQSLYKEKTGKSVYDVEPNKK